MNKKEAIVANAVSGHADKAAVIGQGGRFRPRKW